MKETSMRRITVMSSLNEIYPRIIEEIIVVVRGEALLRPSPPLS
jgi:hypothetical protein